MKKDFWQWSLATLRGRLTLWYIISTGVIFIIFTGLFSSLLWISLYNQIDHHVHIVTEQAQQIVTEFPGAQREKLLLNLVNFAGMSIVLLANDGTEILQANSVDLDRLQPPDLQQLRQAGELYGQHPTHFTLNDMRFGVVPVTLDGESGLLAVGYSVAILRHTFWQLMLITVGVMVMTLVPFAFIGHHLLKRYLKPLEVIAASAQRVNRPTQLAMRVTNLPLTEELQTIVTSFNTMLAQLEKIFQTEHEFFSQAAHTLKTPLAVLRAQVESLTKESLTLKSQMLTTIDTAVETIQNLLLISRIQTSQEVKTTRVNLSQISLELVELAASLAQDKHVTVTHQIAENIYWRADERLLKRALGNVVHNALAYVNQAGQVDLTLTQSEEEVHWTISNTGPGIAPADLPHIFDRFYRGQNAHHYEHGSGLGLAITKAIVEKYGGKIALHSAARSARTTVTIVFSNRIGIAN